MVRTASSSSVRWARETAFGTAPSNINRWFGLDASLDFDYRNNSMPLMDVGLREIQRFAYGQTDANLQVSSTLSTPWPLSLIWDDNTTSVTSAGVGAGTTYTQTWKAKAVPPSVTIEALVDGEDGDLKYQMLGSVVTSARINSNIGDYVKMDMGFKSGKVNVDSATYSAHTAYGSEPSFPFTFRYGALSLGGTAISEVESFSCDIQTGSDLQYDHGTTDAQSPYDGPLNYSGSLRFALRDYNPFKRVDDRQASGSVTLTFDNNITQSATDDKSSIEFTFSSVNFSDIQISLAQVDRIFATANWEATTCTVKVINKYDNRNPTGTQLSAPTSLTAGTAAQTSMPLTWDAVSGATSYRVYYGTSASPTTAFSPDPTTNSVTVTGLTASTTYYFRVAAIKSGVIGTVSSDVTKATTA